MGGAGAANDRRLRQTDERSEEGWWRRRESNPRPETSLRERLQVYPGLLLRRRREGRAKPAAASPIDLAFRPRTEGQGQPTFMTLCPTAVGGQPAERVA